MKNWIKPETWKAIEERRAIKKKVIDAKLESLHDQFKSQYREIDKKIKRMSRSDKRSYMDDLAEKAAEKGEQEKIYKITKAECGKNRNTNSALLRVIL